MHMIDGVCYERGVSGEDWMAKAAQEVDTGVGNGAQRVAQRVRGVCLGRMGSTSTPPLWLGEHVRMLNARVEQIWQATRSLHAACFAHRCRTHMHSHVLMHVHVWLHADQQPRLLRAALGAYTHTVHAQAHTILTHVRVYCVCRYMQIFSHDFCERHWAHTINIHHSFLPGRFMNARVTMTSCALWG